jgi:hypothetical protein
MLIITTSGYDGKHSTVSHGFHGRRSYEGGSLTLSDGKSDDEKP